MASNAAVRKRKRPALSCDPCRRSKIKCSRSFPCEHCGLSKRECTYTSSQSTPSTQHLTSDSSQYGSSSLSPNSRSQVSKTDSDLPSPEETPQTVQQLLERVRELESKLSVASPGPGGTYVIDIDSPRAPINGVFSKTRYFGQSHWMNCFPPSFQLLVDLFHKFEAEPSSEIHDLLIKCKTTSREVKSRDKIPSLISQPLIDYIPARDVADKLVQSYLETFEYIYRVLHVPHFLREYKGYWLDPKSANHTFVTKLSLIMAIGTVFQPHCEVTALRSSALQWIYAAQAWLSAPFDKFRLTLEGLQIQCLLLLARLAHDVDGDLVWLSAGYLLRTAMQMGIHIDAESYTFRKPLPQDIQLRRKLWATILEIVVQTSLDSGGLPLISTSDYDCKSPLNADDMDRKEGPEDSLSHVQPDDQFTQSSLQRLLMRSLPLRLEIATFINNFRLGTTTYDKTMQLSEELLKVCRTNSAWFQTLKASSSPPTNFHVKMVELLTHQYLFALHCPWALKAKSDHIFYYSRKICLDSSLLLLSNCLPIQHDTFNQLRLWGGGIFRRVPLQSVCFIAEELFAQIENDTTSFSKSSTMMSKKIELRRYVQSYAEIAIARIRNGHTNVRCHVMLSGLLAHVDALLSGLPVEESILTALKMSLTTCYEVLRSQLGESHPQSSPFQYDMRVPFDMSASGAMPLQDDIMIPNGWHGLDNLDSMDWWFAPEAMSPLDARLQ